MKNKIVKAIVADNELKRLRITFEDGSLGQLTYKQIESFYGMFYLPDMRMKTPEDYSQEMMKNWLEGTMTFKEAVEAYRKYASRIAQAMLAQGQPVGLKAGAMVQNENKPKQTNFAPNFGQLGGTNTFSNPGQNKQSQIGSIKGFKNI